MIKGSQQADLDLERTAELPMPDFAALQASEAGFDADAVATWVAREAGAPAAQGVAAAEMAELLARAERAERALALRELAALALEARGAELAAEGQRLRARLAEREAQLALREAAVVERDARIARLEAAARLAPAAPERVAALEAEIDGLRERLHRYLETLQSLEGRRAAYDQIYHELESAVTERDARLASERARADRLSAECDQIRAARSERSAPEVRPEDAPAPTAAPARTAVAEAVVKPVAEGVVGTAPARPEDPRPARAPGRRAAAGTPFWSEAGASDPLPEGPARLLIHLDGGAEVVHRLGRRTTVGRTPDNDLQLDTRFISRHHAVILCGPVYTIIEDLNSTNGILVNDQRVARQALEDGDAVTIGRSQFRFALRATAARNGRSN
jgi:hypothetical protein